MATNNPPAEDRIFSDENFAAEIFWEKHRTTILVAVAALLVAAVGVAIWLVGARNARLAAEAAFAQASSPEGWKDVVERFPGTLPAANALFLLAESQREQGALDESTATYRTLISEFPNHPLLGGARLGLAENLGKAGKTDEALAALRDVQVGGGYAAAFAGVLEARQMVRMGKLSEAKEAYQKVIATHTRSPLSQFAQGQVNEIEAILGSPVAPAN
jgi:predicted negative regulator of RcsB-dependent stress response